ncbi:MAG: FtsX-like permease family protein, partial [Ginsengibacter sp.]
LLLISFISGIYPALVLSGFKPIESLKNQLALPGKSSTLLRKSLVVFQFTTSIALIICTIVIARQMNFFNNRSLGFNKEAVVELELPLPDSTKMESLRNRLQDQPGIQKISFCLGAPISDNAFNSSIASPRLSSNINYDVKVLPCDKNYLDAYGIKLLAGRWFFESDEKNFGTSVVVNVALTKLLGFKDPAKALGEKITIGINRANPVIVGVAADFNTTSFHQSIAPIAMLPAPFFYYAAGIRINPGNVKNTLAAIQTAYANVYPEYPVKLRFIDETLATHYNQETRNYNLFKAFSAISIFICCIGLWGLIAFVVVRKTKEIGIRKVLGASVANIVLLLSKDFLKLVVIALVVASPVAWYFMHEWLQNFAYRINISWWIFGLAGLFAIVIALLTISFQAIKAALSNPVKNLRTE